MESVAVGWGTGDRRVFGGAWAPTRVYACGI